MTSEYPQVDRQQNILYILPHGKQRGHRACTLLFITQRYFNTSISTIDMNTKKTSCQH